jgi:hypothetical protein
MSFWTPVENPGTRPPRSRVFDVGCALLAAVASFGSFSPPTVRAGTRLHGSGRLLTGFLVIPGAEAIGDALVGGVGLPVNAVRVATR